MVLRTLNQPNSVDRKIVIYLKDHMFSTLPERSLKKKLARCFRNNFLMSLWNPSTIQAGIESFRSKSRLIDGEHFTCPKLTVGQLCKVAG